jgi:hypothetical protein
MYYTIHNLYADATILMQLNGTSWVTVTDSNNTLL